MRIALLSCLACLPALAQEKPPVPVKPTPVDLEKVFRESKEFRAKCKELQISFGDGIVRAPGEIVYRGGGPCEYLINVAPAKAHETIVLLDDGPWVPPPAKEGRPPPRRPRKQLNGLATVLNNAFIAAGFKKGRPFDWDHKTG